MTSQAESEPIKIMTWALMDLGPPGPLPASLYPDVSPEVPPSEAEAVHRPVSPLARLGEVVADGADGEHAPAGGHDPAVRSGRGAGLEDLHARLERPRQALDGVP